MKIEKNIGDTNRKTDDILKASAVAYIILIIVVLPLYMKNGMVKIGDAKYLFYRNITLFFICITVPLYLKKLQLKRFIFSRTDSFVMLYAGCTVLSYLISEYKEIAFWGYNDWYMGLITQLMLVWSYFFISRYYDGSEMIWYLVIGSSLLIYGIAVLNRHHYDPLGVFRGMEMWEWNRKNLLSTIGNINWYSCYLSVSIPVSLYFLWNGKSFLFFMGGIGSFIGMLTLLTQGSDSMLVAFVAVICILCISSLSCRESLICFIRVLILIPISCILLKYTGIYLKRGRQIIENTGGEFLIKWNGWWVILVCLLFFYTILYVREKNNKEDYLKIKKIALYFKILIGIGMFIVMFTIILATMSDVVWKCFGNNSMLRINDEWGTGRGGIWRLALQGVTEGGCKQIMFGAGPDCFAAYMYRLYDINKELGINGIWADAVFANAHNEYLNMLVNGGILGILSYGGIFFSAYYRFKKVSKDERIFVLGMMIIIGYMANNFFCFQQVMSTPFIFIVLAVFEGLIRKESLTSFPTLPPKKNK
ncbi:hypothetical protein LJC58_04930 [Lachnospiraceae bacterium OttesenSCG-928-D06]|nr:hypothetical protein [Lachnospiraceae bacterium OttesenSCG-928-D06]